MLPKVALRLFALSWLIVLAACSPAGQNSAAATDTSAAQENVLTSTPLEIPATSTPAPTTTLAASSTPSASATPTVPADDIVVDTFDQEVAPFVQNGNCSLGEAIAAAQSGQDVDGCHVPSGSSTIYLPAGTYTLTEPDNGNPPLPGADQRLGFPPGGFPVIYTKVTILGNGAVIQRTGNKKFPIFQATAGADLTLQNLTISGGDNSEDEDTNGGALELLIGKAALDHVTLTGNVSGFDGGAIDIGQAPLATLTLKDSVVEGNLAADNGGGINVDGTLIVQNSIIQGNIAQGVEGGGGIFVTENGTASIDSSQVLGNQAWIGGGIFTQGALEVGSGTLISGNVSTESKFSVPTGGGGIASRGDSASITI